MTLCWEYATDEQPARLVQVPEGTELTSGLQKVKRALASRPRKGDGDKEPITTLKITAVERFSGREIEFKEVKLPTSEFKKMLAAAGLPTPKHKKGGPDFITIYDAEREAQIEGATADGEPVVLEGESNAVVVSPSGDGASVTEVAAGADGQAPFNVDAISTEDSPADVVGKLAAAGMQVVDAGQKAKIAEIIEEITAAADRFNYQVMPDHKAADVLETLARLSAPHPIDAKVIGDRYISLGKPIDGATLRTIGDCVRPIPHGKAELFAREESQFLHDIVPPNDTQKIYTVLLMSPDLSPEQIRSADKEVTAEHQSVVIMTGGELNKRLRDGLIAIVLDAENTTDFVKHIRPSRGEERVIPGERYDIRNAWMAGTGRVIANMAMRVGDPSLANPELFNGPLKLKEALASNIAVRMAFLADHGKAVKIPMKRYCPHQVSTAPAVHGFMAEIMREVRNLRKSGADFVADKTDAEAIRLVLSGKEEGLKLLVVQSIADAEVDRADARKRAGEPDEMIIESSKKHAAELFKTLSAETWPQLMDRIIEDALHRKGDKVVDYEALNERVAQKVASLGPEKYQKWAEQNIEDAFLNPHYMINGTRYERRDHEAIMKALSTTAPDASVSDLVSRVDHLIEMSSDTYATVHELASGARQLAPAHDVMIVHDDIRERFAMKAAELSSAAGLSQDAAERRLHLVMQSYLIDGATAAGASRREPLTTYLEKSFGAVAVIDTQQIESLITDMRLAPVTHAKGAVDANNLSPRHVAGLVMPAGLSQEQIEAFRDIGIANFAEYNPEDPGSVAAAISEFGSGAYVENQPSLATNRGAGGVFGIERIAKELQSQLPYLRVVVCKSPSELPWLPPDYRNAGDRLNAIAHAGAVYVFESGIGMKTGTAVVDKIKHEAMHVGLRRIMPEYKYQELMDRMWVSMSKEDIARIAKRYPHVDQRTAPGRRELAEEWMALHAETLPKERPGLWSRLELDLAMKAGKAFSQKNIDTLIKIAISSNGERMPWLDSELGPDGFLVRSVGNVKVMGGAPSTPIQNAVQRASVGAVMRASFVPALHPHQEAGLSPDQNVVRELGKVAGLSRRDAIDLAAGVVEAPPVTQTPISVKLFLSKDYYGKHESLLSNMDVCRGDKDAVSVVHHGGRTTIVLPYEMTPRECHLAVIKAVAGLVHEEQLSVRASLHGPQGKSFGDIDRAAAGMDSQMQSLFRRYDNDEIGPAELARGIELIDGVGTLSPPKDKDVELVAKKSASDHQPNQPKHQEIDQAATRPEIVAKAVGVGSGVSELPRPSVGDQEMPIWLRLQKSTADAKPAPKETRDFSGGPER